ncbi:MAG: hypothetical protein ACXVYM_02990, partial [Gaiellaceae bacterium]
PSGLEGGRHFGCERRRASAAANRPRQSLIPGFGDHRPAPEQKLQADEGSLTSIFLTRRPEIRRRAGD